MKIKIEKATSENAHNLNRCDGSYQVDSRLALVVNDSHITYTVLPVPSHVKPYIEDVRYREYIGGQDKAVYFAFIDDRLVGQIVLEVYWNRFGYVEEIAVDPGCRKKGVGRSLMEQAVSWAKTLGLAGLMLETQDVNVNACSFYERMGFALSGFDRRLYHATLPGSSEIALFWYLIF